MSDPPIVLVRRDALLYQAMVDRALSHTADPDEWHWDANGKGIWVARSWFITRGENSCKT